MNNLQNDNVETKELEVLLVSANEAARLLGIAKSSFYQFHSSGRIGPLPIKLGRRSLWNRQELADWVAADCPPRVKWQNLRK